MLWKSCTKQQKLLMHMVMLWRRRGGMYPLTISEDGDEIVAYGISKNKHALSSMLFTLCKKHKVEKVHLKNGDIGYKLPYGVCNEYETKLMLCDDFRSIPWPGQFKALNNILQKKTSYIKRNVANTYWTEAQANGKCVVSLEYPKDVDEELIPLLDLINSVPGVRTMFSCCGHTKESFYMVLAFTNLQTRSFIENMVSNNKYVDKHITSSFADEDCYPHAKFTIEEFGKTDCAILENQVGFYSRDLGLKKKAERIKDYKRMCKYIMKLVPRNHWMPADQPKVQKFDIIDL